MRVWLLVVAISFFWTSSTVAQQLPTADDNPVSTAPIRIGPLGLRPRISVSNAGIDSNVFNNEVEPEGDFTMTTTPGLQLFLRTGRGLLAAQGDADLVYYADNANQRAVNTRAIGQYEYRFNRLRPVAAFSVLDSKERPGFEIDERVRRSEHVLRGGVDARLGSKSFFQIDLRREEVVYKDDAFFRGRPLDEALNRHVTAYDGTYRHKLTPLTTLIVRASSEHERFQYFTARNSNSGRLSAGFDLARLALIRGSAMVGFRSLAAADGGTVPPFRGLTADVNVAYTAPTQTRISAQVIRDIRFSYDVATPYYVQTGAELTVTHRIGGRWDGQALGGRDQLKYRQSRPGQTFGTPDYVNRVGGGIGYQLNDGTRVGFNVQSVHRVSPVPGNNYRGIRSFGSVTYGY